MPAYGISMEISLLDESRFFGPCIEWGGRVRITYTASTVERTTNMPANVNISSRTIRRELTYCNTPILKYTCTYPVFSSRNPRVRVDKLNRYYENAAAAFVRYVRQTLWPAAIADYRNSVANGYPIHEYEAVRDYALTENEDCLVSLYTDQYEYTGGAHGSTIRTAQTWLLPQAEKLNLCNLFPFDSTYLARVKLAVIDQIEAQIASGNDSYFDNYRELVLQTFNACQFYLTPEGLIIYFQQYDIAPYSSGIPTFCLPYQMIGAVLPCC